MRRTMLTCACALAALTSFCAAQAQGRVFLPVPDTIAIYEFNGLTDETFPNGTVIPDVSGNGLDAVVEGNGVKDLAGGEGDPDYGLSNREAQRIGFAARSAAIAVNDDKDAFEMDETESFSMELYVNHEDLGFPVTTGDWGILAGTWHSRFGGTDMTGTGGLWYGWGLIRFHWPETSAPGWSLVLSPVQPDGTTVTGQNELKSEPAFEVPLGRHYLVVTVDRSAQTAQVYLDAALMGSIPLQAWMSFVTPLVPGTAERARHARFMMLNGENDPQHPNTWTRYMTPPPGFQLDAVRVTKRALTQPDMQTIWEELENGLPSPSTVLTAVIEPSATALVPNQCVLLDATKSLAGSGRVITKHEWKIGAGAFEEGGATRELSFATEYPDGIAVTLRITNDAAETAEGTVTLKVANPSAQGALQVFVDGSESFASVVDVAKGRELRVAASLSIPWHPPVTQCPITGGAEIPAPTVTTYAWDLNGDGTDDSNAAEPPAWVAAATAEFTVKLTVTTTTGKTSTFTRQVKVVDPKGNAQVFHTTDATILHIEFNDLPTDRPLDPTGIDVPEDLSPNALALAFYDVPDGGGAMGHFVAVPGAAQFDNGNLAVKLIGQGADGAGYVGGPHAIIEQDDNVFEMGRDSDFTFEMYFVPGNGAADWTGLAGTWRARAEGNEADPRYGWGFMALPQTDQYVWFNCNGESGGTAEKWGGQATIPSQRYSYVAVVTDRAADKVTTYLDGQVVSLLDVLDEWTFETPAGYPYHANFCLFARQQRDAEFSTTKPGCTIDALRVQNVALTAEQVLANYQGILDGVGADNAGPSEPSFIRGRINVDGAVNIADAIFLLGYLFAKGTAPTCMDAADANDDGNVNIADAIRLLGHLFASTGPLPPPFGACGTDPTPDAQPPCVFPACQ